MKKRNKSGFTIVEIAVAIAVIGLMVIALSNLFIAVGVIQRQNNHLNLASRAAEAKIEDLRNNHYNTIAPSPPALDFSNELPADLPSPRSALVSVSEPQEGLKQLEVSITYREGTRDKTVRLTGVIGNIGISQ